MAITTLERTQIEKVFIAFLNAAPSITYLDQLVGYAGRADVLAKDLSKTDSFLSIYPVALTNDEFAGQFVANFIGSTASDAAKAYVKDEVVKSLNAGVSRGDTLFNVVVALQSVPDGDPTFGTTKKAFENKVAVADYYAVTKLGTATDLATLHNVIAGVTASSDVSSSTALDTILSGTVTGQTFTLTNGTDIATANVFNAPMVYTPNGDDRILSLQDEDVLTGAVGRTDNTLNATIGQINANEGTSGAVTPVLHNIQNINIDWTGSTTNLDVRNADATTSININRVTADATTVAVSNIGTPAANLRVANTASDNVNVTFQYKTGVLNGAADTAALELNDVLANSINQTSRANVEGFETVNLTVANGVDINALSVNDMENLNITGSGDLTIVNLTATANEYDAFAVGGIVNPGAIGLRTVNASTFTGNLNVDVSAALGGFVDPTNSGAQAHTVITGGTGNDKFWTNAGVAATSVTNRDQINGGAGTNTLVAVGGNIAGNAAITNIQALELRDQAGAAMAVDFDAFDAALTDVLLRDEESGVGAVFNLNDVGATLASSGKIVLHHSITTADAQAVNVTLKADTANDTVAVTVVNDRNTGTTFDYTIDADVPTPTGKVDADQGVENVSIADNDTETNVVTLTSAAEHKGTVTLTGGVAGQSYTVASTLIAKTVDASVQKSDLVLTVGKEDQAIKLGSGNDRLTFDGLDTFNGSDAITDVGGTDTVRAAFSKDVTGAPELAGIENLHIVATANSTLDLAKGTNLTQLVLMSNEAVDQATEVFSTGIAVGQVNLTDVITLKNTKLSEVNFFGDEDAVVAGATVRTAQNFNGLTLENNTGDAVAVKIGAPLQNLTNLAGAGITNYNLGQLTTHGVKDLSIVVSNEVANNGSTTTIANIWDRDLVNLTLTATGNVNVGTVTGNTVNSNIKTVNASAVGGNTTATVKALGDSAVVTLAAGNDVFNALGSAGNNVTIQAGEGNNTITGTAQSDYIYSGAGRDVIDANRGNNTVKSGAGDDTVSALNGSNTVDLGSGKADAATFNYDTVGQLNLATNVVAGSGTSAKIVFNGTGPGVDGIYNTADDGSTATYGFAVGDGAEASIKFTGITFDATASTLNGRSAITGVTTAAAVTAHANYDANQSNLVVFTANPTAAESFTGGSAADVFMDISAGVGNAYNVSTGAGNDAIVIAQTNTGAHTITGGTGADRIVLSAAAGVDTVVLAEGDSTASAWDVITNFKTGADKLDLSSFTTGTAAKLTSTAWADLAADVDATAETVNVAATGEVTIALSGVVANAVIGKDVSVASVISYLAANSTTVNDTFFFRYDSNGSGAIDAADSAVFFQNLGTDLVVELVGSATNNVNGFSVTADLS